MEGAGVPVSEFFVNRLHGAAGARGGRMTAARMNEELGRKAFVRPDFLFDLILDCCF
jgi:hypothetical protein